MIYIACKQIVDEIHKDFKKTYMGVRTSGEIWDECMKAVNNPKLMNDIIYNNDDSGIPPVETYLASSNKYHFLIYLYYYFHNNRLPYHKV